MVLYTKKQHIDITFIKLSERRAKNEYHEL